MGNVRIQLFIYVFLAKFQHFQSCFQFWKKKKWQKITFKALTSDRNGMNFRSKTEADEIKQFLEVLLRRFDPTAIFCSSFSYHQHFHSNPFICKILNSLSVMHEPLVFLLPSSTVCDEKSNFDINTNFCLCPPHPPKKKKKITVSLTRRNLFVGLERAAESHYVRCNGSSGASFPDGECFEPCESAAFA